MNRNLGSLLPEILMATRCSGMVKIEKEQSGT
uniref:Uncharacterized protein n=1 Tax=Nelumbo nucifera TaxID=4432 RepID=A0A822ZQ69_NELNU|nr:TPA_asm: hypothetical protein HUJ06_003729 [Nelumbo nucifera]